MKCVEELLAHEAGVTMKEEYCYTPLDLAKQQGPQSFIDLLMQHKKKCPLEQTSTNYMHDTKKPILSEVTLSI